MAEEGQAEITANSIITQALENAGVPASGIELPAEVVEKQAGIPNLDGTPKGQTKGQLEPEEVVTEPVTKAAEPISAETTEQPLSKADIGALIDQASSRFQSVMDKKMNVLDFQMKQTVGALNQFFQTQEDSSIAGLPAEEQVIKRLERLEKPPQTKIQTEQPPQADTAGTQLYQYLVDMADVAGLKPDDKRLDWGGDLQVTQMSEIVNRFKVSVKAALVADQTKAVQELKDNGDKIISKVRKQAGVDKVSTVGPSGAGLPDVNKLSAIEKIDLGFKIQEELAQTNK